MIYVALLRGINVGGKNKINMKELKEAFEGIGMENVETYINSGNIIFESGEPRSEITKLLETVIQKTFKLNIKVIIRNLKEFEALIKKLPKDWANNEHMKSDVLFLWEEIDKPSIKKEFIGKDGIDEIFYCPGTVLWKTDRKGLTKSGKMQLAKSPLYQKMTIRNVNTTRKIYELMRAKKGK